MGEKKSTCGEGQAKRAADGAEARGHCGCRCEPKRCLPLAGVVLAAVALPLVIRATRRSRGSNGKQTGTPEAAGCCA